MSIIRRTRTEIRKRGGGQVDWARVKSATDEEIDKMIASDADTAPDMARSRDWRRFEAACSRCAGDSPQARAVAVRVRGAIRFQRADRSGMGARPRRTGPPRADPAPGDRQIAEDR